MDTSQRARAIVVWSVIFAATGFPAFAVAIMLFGESAPGVVMTLSVWGLVIALVITWFGRRSRAMKSAKRGE